MDAIKYLRERKRMCNAYLVCTDCPLKCAINKQAISCYQLAHDFPEKAVEIVKKWSEEHPKKTLLTEFLEKYPNAYLLDNGLPAICPKNLDSIRNIRCDSNCEACWNEPLED